MVGDVLRNTNLWRNSLSENADWEPTSRDKFRTTLDDMRQNVTHLANQITGDLPEYTQHDISHLDALWSMADLLAGDAITLNPAAGFVLGAAILTHDLAMSRAAYKISKTNIRSVPEWGDCLALELRRRTGKVPSPTDLVTPPEEVAQEVERILLRKRHALHAEQLPLAEWTNLDGTKSYLINDPAIRSAYGRVVGRIAGSHHWDSHRLPEEFGQPVGAPTFAPAEWTVDQLLLACLLRCADAAHLDASRAPDILAAIAPLPADSRDHWLFQNKLQRPYLADDRLVFTAQSGFEANEISAWWLAFDTLNLVDNELRHVDNILSDNERPRLRANAVSHVDSPRAFSRVAPCHDWEPVEARVQVSDVASLVRRLGGAELYGGDKTVAFRELLVNACDAVKARQALADYRGNAFDGRVTVILRRDGDNQLLEVADNGIGMSPEVLTGPLLDFGHSSWLSNEVVRRNRGLAASQFAPTGKFGIGFFSVFMLGERVKVISRSTNAGPEDTWVLELRGELAQHPILRRAHMEDQLDQPGTTVRVLLDEDLVDTNGHINQNIRRNTTSPTFASTFRKLDRLITFILPCAEASIWMHNQVAGEPPKEIIHAGDWLTMPGSDLLLRISTGGGNDTPNSKPSEWAKHLGPQLRHLTNPDGQIVARVCMIGRMAGENVGLNSFFSLVTAGPARTRSYARGAVGILRGQASSATRDSAIPSVDQGVLAAWLTDEAVRISSENLEPGKWAAGLLQLVSEHGGDSNSLPGWKTADGWLNNMELVEWIAARQEITAVIGFTSKTETYPADIILPNEVIWPKFLPRESPFGATLDEGALNRIFVQAVSEAWSTSPAAVTAATMKPEFTMLADHEPQPTGIITLVLSLAELAKAE